MALEGCEGSVSCPSHSSSSSYWLYNPGWVLVCSTILFHSCLSSTFALQPIIFILFRSSSTWSIHLNLGLPAGLVLYGIHCYFSGSSCILQSHYMGCPSQSLWFYKFYYILLFHPVPQLVICFNTPCSIWILCWPIKRWQVIRWNNIHVLLTASVTTRPVKPTCPEIRETVVACPSQHNDCNVFGPQVQGCKVNWGSQEHDQHLVTAEEQKENQAEDKVDMKAG